MPSRIYEDNKAETFTPLASKFYDEMLSLAGKFFDEADCLAPNQSRVIEGLLISAVMEASLIHRVLKK